MNDNGKALIRKMAEQAKRRMKNRANGNFAKEQNKIKIIYSSENYNLRTLEDDKEEIELYNKIKNLLLSGDNIYNPIAYLTDYNKFSKLDNIGKEKYIFELSSKYQKLKEKLCQEMLNII